MVSLIAFGSGQGTGHCPAGIFKNIISNVTKNEEAGHGPVPCPTLSCAVVRKDIAVDFYGCDAMFCLGSMLFVPKDDPKLLKKPYYNYFLYHNIS